MKLYFRLKDIPELAKLPATERGDIWRDCVVRYAWRHWQWWVGVALAAIIVFGARPAIQFMATSQGWSPFACMFLRIAIVAAAGMVLVQLTIAALRPHFRELADSQASNNSVQGTRAERPRP